MIKSYATYELTLSDKPTGMDPNGALQHGVYVAAVVKLPTRTVMADALNVRMGPGTNFTKSHCIYKGEQVTLYETKGEWARISQSTQDWVHVRYLGV